MQKITKIYRSLFARKIFYKMNKLLYQCSLRGMGILNYENDKVSGEDQFIKRLVKNRKEGIIFDIGANIGDYSEKIIKSNQLMTIYAFEPHPISFSKLKNRINHKNFIAVNAAVGEMAGEVNLYDYAEDDGSSHASLYSDVIEKIHKSKSTHHQVNMLPLDDFVKKNKIEYITLLKIDAEGNELNILKGIDKFLKERRIEMIHFEFNEMNISSRVFFRDFYEKLIDYDIYRLLPNGMIRLNSYNPLVCEIFAYQNIVAILKIKN